VNAPTVATFAQQVSIGQAIGGKQKIANDIRAEPIDLLRHRHVARAQSCFYVGYFNAQFLSGDRACHGRVNISDNDD
jgi:hypothetical protein